MVKINSDLFRKYKTLIFVESKDVNDGYPSIVYYFMNGRLYTQIYKVTKSTLVKEHKDVKLDGAYYVLSAAILKTYHNNSTFKNRNWKLYASNKAFNLKTPNFEGELLRDSEIKLIADSKHFKPKEQLDDLHYKNYLETIRKPYTEQQIKRRKIQVKRV